MIVCRSSSFARCAALRFSLRDVCTVATLLCALVGSVRLGSAAEPVSFETKVLDENAGKVVYAVTTADVDGDGKIDVVAVTENRVVWYQNPTWKPRVIIADQTERDNVCIAPFDIDGDGKVDFALGAGWTKIGTIQWLTRGASLDDKWKVHFIGKEGWTHRMRWGDILGTGKPQLVISPLNKTEGNGIRLLALEIPKQPTTEAWRSHTLDHTLNAMHNHWMGDFDGDGKTDLLTSSMEGVFLFQPGTGAEVKKRQLGIGVPGTPTPQKTGAGEIRPGKLAGNRRFIATVEPMHGNHITVYTEPSDPTAMWTRHVIESQLTRGHAVGVADLDRDGSDEIVFGHSDKGTGPVLGPGVFYFQATAPDGSAWKKHSIDDGGVATEDLVTEDLNSDGFPDIIAGGRATHNVKVYFNRGKK